jgi:PTS system cellobiose-specific IIC component
MVLVTTAYFSTKAGLVPVATSIPPWVTPPIIGGLLATSSFKGAILAAVNLLISVLIYMPFVKISVIQELKKEASN